MPWPTSVKDAGLSVPMQPTKRCWHMEPLYGLRRSLVARFNYFWNGQAGAKKSAAAKKTGDCPGDFFLLLVAQFRVYGQRQNFPAGGLRVGELTLAIAQIGKSGLQM